MTELITAQMVANTTIANINNDLAALETTQNELSTGYKINQPSDDPYGTALTLSLNGQVSAMGSYTSNIADGTAWASTASSSLQSIQQMVESVRELVVESSNGTMSSSDLQDAADEVGQLTDSIKETANTEYDGNYVFSGTATSTAPYQSGSNDTYQGNTGSINRAIGPATTIPINANLSAVLGNGQAANDGGLLDTLRTIATDMTSGNSTALGNDLSSLDTNISSLESVQANVGAAQDRLQMASTRITSLSTTLQTEVGNVEDTDMAQASIQFSTEQAGYQAALQSSADIVQTSLLNFLQSS